VLGGGLLGGSNPLGETLSDASDLLGGLLGNDGLGDI
jgi:hypothetical protein